MSRCNVHGFYNGLSGRSCPLCNPSGVVLGNDGEIAALRARVEELEAKRDHVIDATGHRWKARAEVAEARIKELESQNEAYGHEFDYHRAHLQAAESHAQALAGQLEASIKVKEKSETKMCMSLAGTLQPCSSMDDHPHENKALLDLAVAREKVIEAARCILPQPHTLAVMRANKINRLARDIIAVADALVALDAAWNKLAGLK